MFPSIEQRFAKIDSHNTAESHPAGLKPQKADSHCNRRATDRPKDYERSMDLIVAFMLAVALVLLAGWLGAKP